jgi:hypothetical protein
MFPRLSTVIKLGTVTKYTTILRGCQERCSSFEDSQAAPVLLAYVLLKVGKSLGEVGKELGNELTANLLLVLASTAILCSRVPSGTMTLFLFFLFMGFETWPPLEREEKSVPVALFQHFWNALN